MHRVRKPHFLAQEFYVKTVLLSKCQARPDADCLVETRGHKLGPGALEVNGGDGGGVAFELVDVIRPRCIETCFFVSALICGL